MANGYLHHQGTKFYPAPFYPIGSIFISATYFNPSTYFGGTWVQLKNAFLYASGNTSGTGSSGNGTGTSTGGNSGNTGSTTLTIDQIPSHNHHMLANKNPGGDNAGIQHTWGTAYAGYDSNSCGYTGGGKGHTHTLNNHTHTIPYISVFVWKRTA